jgi:crossover junction endodeoxyribonuclease RuvC
LWRWIGEHDPDRAYIETATAMPAIPDSHGHRRGMGAGTMARYMRAAGAIDAAVELAGLHIVHVMPAQWKRAVGLVGPNKRDSLAVIRATYPADAGRWFSRQKDHNRAEAALIAMYGAARADMIDLKPTHAMI